MSIFEYNRKIKQVKIIKEYKKGCLTLIVICIILAPITFGISLLGILEAFFKRNKIFYDFVIIYEDDSRELKKKISDKKN